jgi:hypothetical protein
MLYAFSENNNVFMIGINDAEQNGFLHDGYSSK